MRTYRNLWLAVAAVALSIAPCAFGQGQVNINLTGAGNNVMDGVYVGPYTATVNGSSTQIICDDFSDESYVGESWTANVTTLSNLNGTKWGGMANATHSMTRLHGWPRKCFRRPIPITQPKWAIWPTHSGHISTQPG